MAYRPAAPIKHHRLSAIFIPLAVLVVVLVLGAALWSLRPKHAANLTSNSSSSGSTTTAPSNTGSGAGVSKTASNGKSTPTVGSSVRPAAPTGQFVSNHLPDLSGQPYPDSETSTCSTTPDVICTITFTMGSTTKSLPAKRTNANGDAVWSSWTLQQIGLTQGKWQITATASSGNLAATTTDPTVLEVGP